MVRAVVSHCIFVQGMGIHPLRTMHQGPARRRMYIVGVECYLRTLHKTKRVIIFHLRQENNLRYIMF